MICTPYSAYHFAQQKRYPLALLTDIRKTPRSSFGFAGLFFSYRLPCQMPVHFCMRACKMHGRLTGAYTLHHSRGACGHCRGGFFDDGDGCFCGEEAGCHAGCVLECASGDLCGIKDTAFDHVDVLFFVCVKADADFRLFNLVDDISAVEACILSSRGRHHLRRRQRLYPRLQEGRGSNCRSRRR